LTTSVVLPAPGGPQTHVTGLRRARSSRRKSRGRATVVGASVGRVVFASAMVRPYRCSSVKETLAPVGAVRTPAGIVRSEPGPVKGGGSGSRECQDLAPT